MLHVNKPVAENLAMREVECLPPFFDLFPRSSVKRVFQQILIREWGCKSSSVFEGVDRPQLAKRRQAREAHTPLQNGIKRDDLVEQFAGECETAQFVQGQGIKHDGHAGIDELSQGVVPLEGRS